MPLQQLSCRAACAEDKLLNFASLPGFLTKYFLVKFTCCKEGIVCCGVRPFDKLSANACLEM
jgi:hypothetical protein